ncbi:ABC transporter substrate-binding protein [Acidithiobacillus sp. HP-6]|uniref:ABC transporter substrate-binding protein n=1 Tax=unclassified Acidithiobacillus TaxID=2614800 RepID=UPI001879364A|nr:MULTISPECIES: ABC transporter substrate-binding protein [unclassified Acidithiobacillus]MBE7562327.1 ABC transporter substrate-binding protein [Acidithiobacillus sp. HP-6]MBE7570879.1 ABC transporter substrate-binding protein [Acidithiobacillus sp. HP-2]
MTALNKINKSWKKTIKAISLTTGMFILCPGLAIADPNVVFGTNWFAEAQHGGYYEAVATGLYKKFGLNVKIDMGGPEINGEQLLAAGKYQFYMGNGVDQLIATAHGLPLVTVATIFQKSPTCIYAHEDITKPQQLANPKYQILVSSNEIHTWWPWAIRQFGYHENQRGVYTGSVAPFLADKNIAQQGFYGSEDYMIAKAGVKFHTYILADYGYPEYSETIQTTEEMIKKHPEIVKKFIEATMLGWKEYLKNPAPGNSLIMKANPKQTPSQLAYGVKTMKDGGLLVGSSEEKDGLGTMTTARWKKIFNMAAENGDVPKTMDWKKGFSLKFIKDIHVAMKN